MHLSSLDQLLQTANELKYKQLQLLYTIFGSRPSDNYFRSVCRFACLCSVFLSRL